MFGSGPELNQDAKHFLCRLEEHPEIEFLGAFCQAQSQSFAGGVHRPVETSKLAGFSIICHFGYQQGHCVFSCILLKKSHFKESWKKSPDRIHFVANIHAQNVLEQVSALTSRSGSDLRQPYFETRAFRNSEIGHTRYPSWQSP